MVRLITSIVFLFSTTQLFAQQYLANNGEISFFSEAPMEDIYAVNKEVSAVYDAKTNDLVFQLEINDFVFPKSLMQEHFNENYLESDIYPKSIFSGKVISQDGKNAIVEGDLTIHGKTNKIKVEGILQQEKKVINISAEFIVKLEDYDIKIPTIVMYKIAEEIEVKVNIGLKERK
ncbi:MAG TPA: YceI family protein [Flavobacteriales bacterium]|nr:YceI family protein [Flavobacteriales bacterium]HIK63309.1 YceI family protein [Flavobacteriales bacterium]